MSSLKVQVFQLSRKLRKHAIKYNDYVGEVIKLREKYGRDTVQAFFTEAENVRIAAKNRLDFYKLGQIKQYCNRHLFSDIMPYEVVSTVSRRKVIIREMDAILEEAPKTFHEGGFCGHFDNSEQVWRCVSNESNPLIPITLTKKGWGQGMYRMSDKPMKFYDYNY